MTYHLFLDDERTPEQVTWVQLPNVVWTIVRTVEAFEETLKTQGRPESVSFDNDLQTKLEGRHAARLLCNHCLDNNWELPTCYIHSKNPEAWKVIESILNSFIKARAS